MAPPTMLCVLDVLLAVLVAAAVLLPVAAVVVGVVRPSSPSAHSAVTGSLGLRRTALAAVSVGLGAIVIAGVTRVDPLEQAIAAAVVGLSTLAWLPLGRTLASRGIAAWALAVDTVVVGLAYAAAHLVTGDLPAYALVLGLVAWGLGVIVGVVGLAHGWTILSSRTRCVPTEPGTSPRWLRPLTLERPARSAAVLLVSATTAVLVGLAVVVVSPAPPDRVTRGVDDGAGPSPTTPTPTGASPGAPDSADRSGSVESGSTTSVPPAQPTTAAPSEPASSDSPATEPTQRPTSEPDEEPNGEPGNDRPPGKPEEPPGKPTDKPHKP